MFSVTKSLWLFYNSALQLSSWQNFPCVLFANIYIIEVALLYKSLKILMLSLFNIICILEKIGLCTLNFELV